MSRQAGLEAVTRLMVMHQRGGPRSCGLVDIFQSLYRPYSKRPDRAPLKERIIELARQKRRYGFRLAFAATSRRPAAKPEMGVSGLSQGKTASAPWQTQTECRDVAAKTSDGRQAESKLVDGLRLGLFCGWKVGGLSDCRGRFRERMFGHRT